MRKTTFFLKKIHFKACTKKGGGGIAFFDSGIGGLTVLSVCRKYLPNVTFYYFGDNAHAPYGNLPPKKIYRYTYKAFKRFKRLKVAAAVVACNTATAVCIEKLRKRFNFPIIGTEPAVCTAASKGGEIFVLTTRATHESMKFQRLCAEAGRRYPNAVIIPIACDALAGKIERHLQDADFDFTPFLPRGRPNVVVLGCTHYIYIKEAVKKFYGCEVIDGNEGVATRLLSVLKTSSVTTDMEKTGNDRDTQPHLTTDFPSALAKKGKDGQKSPKTPKNSLKSDQIFFLGNAQVVNKTQYEQMFGVVYRQK